MEAAFGASVDDKQSTEETFLVKGAQLRVCSNTFCHFSRITTCRISRVQLMQSAHWRCDKSSRQNFPSPQCLKEYRQLYKSTHPNRQLYKSTHPNRQITNRPTLIGSFTNWPTLIGSFTNQPTLIGSYTYWPTLIGSFTNRPILIGIFTNQPTLIGSFTNQPCKTKQVQQTQYTVVQSESSVSQTNRTCFAECRMFYMNEFQR